MHIVSIISETNEFQNALQSSIVNTILLSYEDYKNENIRTWVNQFSYRIIVCNKSHLEKSSKYTLFLEDAESSKIIKKLNSFINKISEKAINRKVRKILEKFNFDFKLIGTHYLLESIVYSYLTKDSYSFENLQKNIYPHIAKKYNTTVSSVKWSIIRSINNSKASYSKNDLENLPIDIKEKFTPKTIITLLVARL